MRSRATPRLSTRSGTPRAGGGVDNAYLRSRNANMTRKPQVHPCLTHNGARTDPFSKACAISWPCNASAEFQSAAPGRVRRLGCTVAPVDEEFLTVAEVAAILKLNQQTVRNWIDEGSLPAFRLGRRVRIRRSDLDRFVEAGSTVRRHNHRRASGVARSAARRAGVSGLAPLAVACSPTGKRVTRLVPRSPVRSGGPCWDARRSAFPVPTNDAGPGASHYPRAANRQPVAARPIYSVSTPSPQ